MNNAQLAKSKSWMFYHSLILLLLLTIFFVSTQFGKLWMNKKVFLTVYGKNGIKIRPWQAPSDLDNQEALNLP